MEDQACDKTDDHVIEILFEDDINSQQPNKNTHSPNDKELNTKTTKALQIVLGQTSELVEFDKIKHSLNQNPKSRYLISRYENSVARIQVILLKEVKVLQNIIKDWDKDFFLTHDRLPSNKEYANNNEISQYLKQYKVANKLLQQWGITVHLVS